MIVKIPNFKNSQEAIKFGASISDDKKMINSLLNEYIMLLRAADILKDIIESKKKKSNKGLNELIRLATRAQLVRESYDSAVQKRVS